MANVVDEMAVDETFDEVCARDERVLWPAIGCCGRDGLCGDPGANVLGSNGDPIRSSNFKPPLGVWDRDVVAVPPMAWLAVQ